MERKSFETEIAGKKLIIETGRFARQAHGACTVRYGDTVVLATAVMSPSAREGIDYFPLLVDFEERLYAAGKIKGSRFIKREGRASDEAILTGRLIDRTIRPLFDDRSRRDVQVVLTVLSVDQENDSDIPSLIAASAALMISPIPWAGPVAGVRVGRIQGEWVLNPTYEARDKSDLDLVVCGGEERIIMVEAGADEIDEKTIADGIQFAQKHIRKILELIVQVQQAVGLPKEMIEAPEGLPEVVKQKVESLCGSKIDEFLTRNADKKAQKEFFTSLRDEVDAALKADNEVSKEQRELGVGLIETMYEQRARTLVLEKGTRVDGRKPDEIRKLTSDVAILPRTHGSGLFERGETQILSVVTLGSPGDEQMLDTMELSGKKRYMHHYNFPKFSTGEVGPLRGPGRREIGHGALAEKALLPVIPEKEAFPYTIRVVSEALASNGSTSQGSICGSSLALMDAGVPIKAPVAGISIGLISDEKELKEYKIITDIQGVEDHNGDMDFKIAGTRKGITAIQMDTKLSGITYQIAVEALEAGKVARAKILDVMEAAISAPRPELSPYAPRITTLRVDPEKIRTVIGKGGETINKIIDECGGADVIKIDIEDDGLIMITSHKSEMAEKAKTWIEQITKEVEIGEIYEGTVTQIMTDRMSGSEIGAIVEILPGHEGMVHISEFSYERIGKVSDVVEVGQKLKVKVMNVDKERGRIALSVKALTEPPEGADIQPHRPHGHGGPHRGFGGRRPAPRRYHD